MKLIDFIEDNIIWLAIPATMMPYLVILLA